LSPDIVIDCGSAGSAEDAVMKPVAEYVVDDPPAPGFPYLAVLFRTDMPPRVFLFQTFEQATEFLTG
jgi:hypothetical protein